MLFKTFTEIRSAAVTNLLADLFHGQCRAMQKHGGAFDALLVNIFADGATETGVEALVEDAFGDAGAAGDRPNR